MNRREFLKRAGALAVAAASGRPMMLLGGFGGGSYRPKSLSTDKIPFEDTETLEAIREKIAYNGYSFTVGRTTAYDQYGYPGTPPYPTLPQSGIPTYAPYSDIVLGSEQSLPSSFDIRNINGHSYIGPIMNEKSTNICWAFGACDAASAVYNLKNGLFDDNCAVLSPTYLRWVVLSNAACDPGLGALYALTKSGAPNSTPTGLEGACQDIDFPFASYPDSPMCLNPPPRFLIEQAKQAPRITLRRCAMVHPADYMDTTAQIKAAIYRYGAVRVAVRQYPAAFKAYKSGVYEDTFTEPADPYYKSVTGHSVSLVGWDDNPPEGGGGCWILRNEWGTSWGENGYMRIRYFSAHINCKAEFIEASSPGDGELTIKGKVTVDGAGNSKTTVTLTGDDTFAVVTDSGKYTFQTLKAGRYVVTPTQPDVIFSPSSQEVVVSDQDITSVDFTGNMFL